MMTRPLRAFSLRISSTVPRLELDTGRPARHVRDLEYHTGEHGFLPVSLSSLTSYSDDTAPKFDGCPVGGAQSIKGTTAIGRLSAPSSSSIIEHELIRENTMFFDARSKTEPNDIGRNESDRGTLSNSLMENATFMV